MVYNTSFCLLHGKVKVLSWSNSSHLYTAHLYLRHTYLLVWSEHAPARLTDPAAFVLTGQSATKPSFATFNSFHRLVPNDLTLTFPVNDQSLTKQLPIVTPCPPALNQGNIQRLHDDIGQSCCHQPKKLPTHSRHNVLRWRHGYHCLEVAPRSLVIRQEHRLRSCWTLSRRSVRHSPAPDARPRSFNHCRPGYCQHTALDLDTE